MTTPTSIMGQSARLKIPVIFAGERASGKSTWLLRQFLETASQGCAILVLNAPQSRRFYTFVASERQAHREWFTPTEWWNKPIPVVHSLNPSALRGFSGYYVDEIQAFQPEILKQLQAPIYAATLNLGRG